MSSSEASLFWLGDTCLLIVSSMILSLCTHIPGVSLSLSKFPLIKTSVRLALGLHFNLITSLRRFLQIQSDSEFLGVRASTQEFWETQFRS